MPAEGRLSAAVVGVVVAADEAVVAPAMEEGERMATIPPLRLVADEVEEADEREEEEEDGGREGMTTVEPRLVTKKTFVGGEEEDERGGHEGEEELLNPLPARMTWQVTVVRAGERKEEDEAAEEDAGEAERVLRGGGRKEQRCRQHPTMS